MVYQYYRFPYGERDGRVIDLIRAEWVKMRDAYGLNPLYMLLTDTPAGMLAKRIESRGAAAVGFERDIDRTVDGYREMLMDNRRDMAIMEVPVRYEHLIEKSEKDIAGEVYALWCRRIRTR